MFNRAELKYQARQQLKEEYWPALLVSVVAFFLMNPVQPNTHIPYTLYGVLLFLSGNLFRLHGLVFTLILMTVLYIFVGGPILVGRSKYFLSSVRGQWQINDLFFLFRSKSYWNAIFVMFIFMVILSLGTVLCFAFLAILLLSDNLSLTTNILVGFGIVSAFIALIFFYRFRFITYILADHPKMKAGDVLKLAFDLTEHERWYLFLFDFSFFGWYFLGSLAFGVGTFFVMPYHGTSVACLYLELKEQNKKHDLYKKVEEEFSSTDSTDSTNSIDSAEIGSDEYDSDPSPSIQLVKNKMKEEQQEDIKPSHIGTCRKGFALLILSFFLFGGFSGALYGHAKTHDQAVSTYQCLQEAIDNGVNPIVIDGDFSLEGPILIQVDTTITGKGTIRVDGNFDHFQIIATSATLTLEGEIILEGMVDGTQSLPLYGGGVLVNGGTFQMMSGEIRNIEPFIWRYEGENKRFGSVTVINSGRFYMYDGLIHESNGYGVLIKEGSIFHMYDGEISNHQEAGVHIHEEGKFNFHDGLLSNNSNGISIHNSGVANMYGGVITNHHDSGVKISDRHGAGAVFNLHDGLISRNVGLVGGGVSIGDGRFSIHTFHMYGGTISYNEAELFGGGVYVYSGFMNLHGGEISGNRTLQDGFVHSPHGYYIAGGGIALFSGYLYMTNGIIRDNSSYNGGGIFIDFQSQAAINGGQITGNHANGNGGGIFQFVWSTLSLAGVEIKDNVALSSGGGIYRSRFTNDFAVGPDVVFSGNTADGSTNFGLAAGRERYPHIMWYGTNSVEGTHIFNNYDINFDGRWTPAVWQIYLVAAALFILIMLLSTLIFYKKRQKKLAVGILLLSFFLFLPVQQIYAGDVEVTDEEGLRRAIFQGAGIIKVNDVIQLQDVIEIDNSITITGSGRIEVSDNHRHFQINSSGKLNLEGELTLTRTQEYNGYGGGIKVTGTLTMNGGNIVGNTGIFGFYRRGQGGSGVFVTEGGSFYMNEGLIRENTGNWGGGVSVEGEGSSFQMNGGVISDNTGNWGGGAYVGGSGSSFYLNGGTIGNNTSNWGGGVFLGRGASMTLFDGEIRNNRADINGGGISFDGSRGNPPSLRMYGGLITENSAGFMGGGLALCSTDRRMFSHVSRAWLFGGEISHNTATGHGGVYSSTFSQLTIGSNSRIRNNYPVNSYEENISILSRITTPNIFRLAVVLAIAGVGTFFTIKKQNKVPQQDEIPEEKNYGQQR